MKSFSEAAARTWSKDHVRSIIERVVQDIKDIVVDIDNETNPPVRTILREKLDSLREERDFLRDLL